MHRSSKRFNTNTALSLTCFRLVRTYHNKGQFQNSAILAAKRCAVNNQIINLIDIDTAELKLSDPRVTPETVDELYQFGSIVLADVRQRASGVESKLTT